MTPTASGALRDTIRAILSDPQFDDPACDLTRDEVIWDLVAEHGWDGVRDEMLSLLRDDAGPPHWRVATIVIWRGVDLPMPAVQVIALLHHRLLADASPEHALDENLVWSIVSNLKGVDYLSDYDPARDPEVQAELARLSATDEPDDDALIRVELPQDVLSPPTNAKEALLAHIQALRDDIARYSAQLAAIEAGRDQPGPDAAALRSALKHRTEHLALMEARLAEGA
jgi:hypothetical protein